MTRLLGLLALFVVILVIQAVALTEAFGSSQGGAQIQLAASHPVMYLAVSDASPPPTLVTSMTPGSLQIPQPQQASVSSWLSPY
jgi:hypothetical protein